MALRRLAEHRVGDQPGECRQAGDDEATQRAGVVRDNMTKNGPALEDVC
jgi:hypothetical protein